MSLVVNLPLGKRFANRNVEIIIHFDILILFVSSLYGLMDGEGISKQLYVRFLRTFASFGKVLCSYFKCLYSQSDYKMNMNEQYVLNGTAE